MSTLRLKSNLLNATAATAPDVKDATLKDAAMQSTDDAFTYQASMITLATTQRPTSPSDTRFLARRRRLLSTPPRTSFPVRSASTPSAPTSSRLTTISRSMYGKSGNLKVFRRLPSSMSVMHSHPPSGSFITPKRLPGSSTTCLPRASSLSRTAAGEADASLPFSAAAADAG